MIGIEFYRMGDIRYKWFIKPCILLFIFDLVSWISYSFLFTNINYQLINPTLTFSLTISTTGIAFIFLYNNSPEKFRTQSFYVVLTSIISFVPIFIYFFLISYFPIHLPEPIPLLIAFNIAILLFYLSIGIYQWNISWAIWRTGWWIWNLLPIINFLIIYNIVTEINVITNATNILGDLDVLIITIILCTLIELPALYTWIKEHFYLILFLIWGESLFLIYYISLNLFIGNLILINLFFFLFSIVSLMPLIYQLRFWSILSKMWLLLAVINVLFFSYLMESNGITNLGVIYSIGVLIFGLFFLVYSYFPNIQNQTLIIIVSYLTIITGIFLTILSILYSIILDLFISVNIAFIVLGFSLFSSKYVKLNRKYTNWIASWIIITNFSLLTFNTFNLLPEMEVFAFFLALTVFGGSFFVFNHYKIIGPINRGIPWMIMGFGLASSISSLFIMFLDLSLILTLAFFTAILLIFLYFILDEYKYLMVYLIPTPFTFLILELLLLFEIFQPIVILLWLFLYFSLFQIVVNSFKYFFADQKTKIDDKNFTNFFKNKNQVKFLNFTCLIINSTCISLVIVITSVISLVSQVLLFLILWSSLILCCLKYFKSSELVSIFPHFNSFTNRISLILYLLPPIALSIISFQNLSLQKLDIVFIVLLSLLVFTGFSFIELFLVDNIIFKYISDPIKKRLIFYSWGLFCNILCYTLYIVHSNVFLFLLSLSLLNLITFHFLNQLPLKNKDQISKSRIILFYVILITSSLYIASLITDIVVFYYNELFGTASILFFLLNSVVLLIILLNFVKTKIKLKFNSQVQFFLLLTVQVLLFSVYWTFIFITFKIVNFFSIGLIVLIETCLFYISIYIFGQMLSNEKKIQAISNFLAFIILLIYFEISFVFFGLCFEFLGLYESILISQIILFAETLLDIYFIEKLKKFKGYLFHTFSYIIISCIFLLFLIQYWGQALYFLSLALLILISMQFYTFYCVFKVLNHVYPDKKQALETWRNRLYKSIGVLFYSSSLCFLYNVLNLAKMEMLSLLLIIVCIIHGLTYVDKVTLKFLENFSNTLKIISWILIMIISSFYLSFIFTFSLFIIPGVMFLLILEINYLFYLLKNIKLIASYREKIKKAIIIAFYINIITWPLFYATYDGFYVLNLLILSIVIFYLLTYIDNYLMVLNENFRLNLRKSLFFTIAIFLSIDIFIFLEYHVQPTNPFFEFMVNLSISFLIFLVLAAILIKPFKIYSKFAVAYWNICFLFVSILFYYFFLSWEVSVFFFIISFILYWFIFTLERIREL
ncbi:MAG: hypothetical protein ACFFAO_14030, partial [Candidatus Hermodarchaeota archaeon]